MKKINNKSINLALKTLTILAFSLLFIPATTFAAYGTNVYFGGGNYFDGNNVFNPSPSIDGINPSYAVIGSGPKTITVTGNGFVPASIARVNGADRPTTFIDYAHLFVQISATDVNNPNGFFITVWNPAPGGGYSNSETFTINNVVANVNNNSQNNTYSNSTNSTTYSSNTDSTNTSNNTNSNSDTPSNLASNVIFGSTDSFMPSGIIQWILFAILVLVIVILVRKISGASDEYHDAPLKHD